MPISLYMLNVNKACQLRCEWCYAQGQGYSTKDNMPLELAMQINKMLAGSVEARILGGEPTLYPHLYPLLLNLRENNTASAVVSNGLIFSDEDEVKQLKDAGVGRVSVSVKAFGNDEYAKRTGSRAYCQTLRAIENLAKNDVRSSTSITLTGANYPQAPRMVKDAARAGSRNFHFNFCVPVFGQKGESEYLLPPERHSWAVMEVIDAVESCGAKYGIELMVPFCWFQPSVLLSLFQAARIFSGCSSWTKRSVCFDSNGGVFVCNSFTGYPFAKFGVDFTNHEELCRKLENQQSFFQMMRRAPSAHCLSCCFQGVCGGGCPIRWTAVDPSTITGGDKFLPLINSFTKCFKEEGENGNGNNGTDGG